MDLFTITVNAIGFLLIAIGLFTFVYVFWRFSDPVFNRISLKRRRQYTKVFNRLVTGICQGAVQDEKDIKCIYETSFNTSYIQYIDFLKRFKSWLGMNNAKDHPADNLIKAANFIKPIIDAELEREPYEGLSNDDKSAFTSIENLIAKSDYCDAIKTHLATISKSLRSSNESVKSNSLLNRFALGVSIASILVTVGLQFFTKTSLSKESIESINNNTKQQIELAVDSIRNNLTP